MKHAIRSGEGWTALEGNPDTLAVIGARTSRAANVRRRFEEMLELAGTDSWEPDEAPEDVQKFLRRNLGEYGHGSIADMSTVTVVLEDIPHYLAWIITDSPLFKGQETSTRAVRRWHVNPRYTEAFASWHQPELPAQLVKRWEEIHHLLTPTRSAEATSYPHDLVRFFVPQCASTTVTIHGTVYDIVKTVDSLAIHEDVLPGAGILAGVLVEAIESVSPLVAECLDLRARLQSRKGLSSGFSSKVFLEPVAPDGQARVRYLGLDDDPVRYASDVSKAARDFPQGVVITPDSIPDRWLDIVSNHLQVQRRQHLPAEMHLLPRPDFFVWGSLAAARDWHRHRRLFPFSLTIDSDHGKGFQWSAEALQARKELLPLLSEGARARFIALTEEVQSASILHPGAIPLGARTVLASRPTWPALAYALILRASAKGAHAEYARQASSAISSVCVAKLYPHLRSTT